MNQILQGSEKVFSFKNIDDHIATPVYNHQDPSLNTTLDESQTTSHSTPFDVNRSQVPMSSSNTSRHSVVTHAQPAAIVNVYAPQHQVISTSQHDSLAPTFTLSHEHGPCSLPSTNHQQQQPQTQAIHHHQTSNNSQNLHQSSPLNHQEQHLSLLAPAHHSHQQQQQQNVSSHSISVHQSQPLYIMSNVVQQLPKDQVSSS